MLYYIILHYIYIYIYICIIYKCNVYVCIYIYMYNLIWSIYWQKPFAILVTNTWRNLRSGPGASGWTLQQQASQGWVFFHLGPGLTWPQGLSMFTLWLCQNSYWKLWFIVDFPMKNGGSFHSYVNVYQRVSLLEQSQNIVDERFINVSHLSMFDLLRNILTKPPFNLWMFTVAIFGQSRVEVPNWREGSWKNDVI